MFKFFFNQKVSKIGNKQTYKIVRFVLNFSVESPSMQFMQKDLVNDTKVSKAWASKLLKRLERKGYVKRINNKYSVRKPLELISLFPLFRSMNDNLIQSFSVEADRKELLKFFKKKKTVLCGTSALQHYSTYFRDPSINFYSKDKTIINELKNIPNGLIKINIYKPDLLLELDTEKKTGFLLTSKVRTIIDLFCDNKAHAAEELIKQLW